MRNWQHIWNTANETGGPDWSEPETYIEMLSLLIKRGEDWLECLLQLADRPTAVSELAGERLTVESYPLHDGTWQYTIRGMFSKKTWGSLVMEPSRGLDDLVLLALIRVSFNGREHTPEQEFNALTELLAGSGGETLFDCDAA